MLFTVALPMTGLAAPSLPITIESCDDFINIVAYVNISGDAADMTIGGTTYRQAFIDGVIHNWSGDKDGVYVTVTVIDVADNPIIGQRSLDVIIRQGPGISRLLAHIWWMPRLPGTIVLYQGDFRCAVHGIAHRYNVREFRRVSAHEFGHALGICDTQRRDLRTIMGPRVWFTTATRLDLELALRAHETERWQTFERNSVLIETYGELWGW